ncbi:GNAT family N-acetyltransferase [Microscilla marina]|uniref:Acetyltransferase, gnat family n=1 Tax=Microscilla marina ATCC 23134 TaxID=313606 RepID=A1ZLZ9_MICM2|nr:GNAT family N-acetyltransferase [Microscilla marina]EAY28531.1 acetyltransferase, gnat family [Microscilla marina ATCC 23134]
METYQVHITEENNKGKAYIGTNAKPLAAMTYSKAGNDLIIIDHTEVDQSLRGQNIGRQLLDALVAMARNKGIKIMPLCPYAKSVFDKDNSLKDVLK